MPDSMIDVTITTFNQRNYTTKVLHKDFYEMLDLYDYLFDTAIPLQRELGPIISVRRDENCVIIQFMDGLHRCEILNLEKSHEN